MAGAKLPTGSPLAFPDHIPKAAAPFQHRGCSQWSFSGSALSAASGRGWDQELSWRCEGAFLGASQSTFSPTKIPGAGGARPCLP